MKRWAGIAALSVLIAALLFVARESRPMLLARFALERARGGSACVIEVEGVRPFRMFLNPESLVMTPFILRERIWEAQESKLAVRSLREGDVAVDLGANVGYYTLLAGKLVGDAGRVYAFEPDPVNFALLERNVRLNGLRNVVLEQRAASNANGDALLFANPRFRGDSRLYDVPAGEPIATLLGIDEPRETVEVKTIRLDDYFTGRETAIDFIKIDTQGAEAVILEGMRETLLRSTDLVMALEFVPQLIRDFGADPEKMMEQLAELDLRYYQIGLRRFIPRDPDKLLAKFGTGPGTNLVLVRRSATRDPAAELIGDADNQRQ